MMKDTHNGIGVTEEVSGSEFLNTAREQIESYGTDFERGFVEEIERIQQGGPFCFTVGDKQFTSHRVILATGFSDKRPDPLLPRTGAGLHCCLHCDAYMFIEQPVYVMGKTRSAAHMAMVMFNFTSDVDLLCVGQKRTGMMRRRKS